MSSRVLVTGATGRIGNAVATQLLERGVTTRAMVLIMMPPIITARAQVQK